MKRLRNISLFLTIFVFSSCTLPKVGGYQKESLSLRPGMNKAQVIADIGNPKSTSFTRTQEILLYEDKGASFLGGRWMPGTHRLIITLENDRVVKWKATEK